MELHLSMCGAGDGAKCAFPTTSLQGTVVEAYQEKARKERCRVMRYTDLFKRTGSYEDE